MDDPAILEEWHGQAHRLGAEVAALVAALGVADVLHERADADLRILVVEEPGRVASCGLNTAGPSNAGETSSRHETFDGQKNMPSWMVTFKPRRSAGSPTISRASRPSISSPRCTPIASASRFGTSLATLRPALAMITSRPAATSSMIFERCVFAWWMLTTVAIVRASHSRERLLDAYQKPH